MRRSAAGLLILGLAVVPQASHAQNATPDGVTPATIEEGKKLFGGQGLCMACHGMDAKGVPNLGADLTDAEWKHSDGSFNGILATITAGVTSDKSTTGTVMPPKGGAQLNDTQLRAVAAYVWSISRKK